MIRPCAHCGATTVDAPAEGPAFCCPGCRAVHTALVEAGLTNFYDLRDRMGEVSLPASNSATEGRYRHYDDPEFLARFAPGGDEVELQLEGVHCAACVWVLEQLPAVVPGVRRARLDFGRARVALSWDPASTSLSEVAEAVHRLGYPSAPLGQSGEAARRRADRRALVRLGVTGALAGNSMMIAGALYAGAEGDAAFAPAFEWLSLGLAVPAVTYGAVPFYRGALAGLRVGVAHLDLPIVIGLLAGFFASLHATLTGVGAVYYDSVTALVFLLLAGRFVQRRGQQAAMNRAELLAALTPGRAWRWVGAAWTEVPATALRPGDRVRIRAGESFPADGEVIDGDGHADLRLLTGEARPAPVTVGGRVFAGTVNLGATLEVRVEAVGPETRVGGLMQRVGAEDAERAPLVRMADRLAGRFVVAVLLLAAVGGLGWWWLAPERAFAVVISLLVVTCPCALGLATPVALAVARGQAARAGVLFRSTAAIERLAGAGRICFDKTGTLTEGALQVRDAQIDPSLRALVGALTAQSVHPVSQALARWGGGEAEVTAVRETPGVGLAGRVAGRSVAVGAPLHLAPDFEPGRREAIAARGQTPVAVLVDDAPAGLIGVGDSIRADAAAAVRRLRGLGLRVEVLSGDHPKAVEVVAGEVGVQRARGGASPEDKAAAVADGDTIMVGDGLNDAAALRAARVGIAIRGGAEVALQVADAYLTDTRLERVADAVSGARRTLGVVRRNLGFSLVYNLVFATLALAGLVSPLAAAVLMPLSSLTVVGHSVLSRPFANRAPRVESPRGEGVTSW